MGLPMWVRAPSPDATATKADVTAPARSPIRRRLPARPPRAPRSPRDTYDHHHRDSLELVGGFHFNEAAPPLPPPRASGALRVPVPPPPPPPVPESRNYARHREALRERRQARGPAFGEVSRTSRPRAFAPGASWYPPTDLDAVTHHFRPSRRSPPSTIPADPPRRRERESASIDGSVNWGPLDDPVSDRNAVGLPPLRRVGRRTIADGPLPSSSLRESWSPVTEGTIDGLGDRERSMSPFHHHWDTMLSTVAPDPLAPSAESSFTSAAASASFSNSHTSSRAGSANSNSAASARTHLTVPSRRHSPPSELLARACETSDSETTSETDDDDDEANRQLTLLRAYRRTFGRPDHPDPAFDARHRSSQPHSYMPSDAQDRVDEGHGGRLSPDRLGPRYLDEMDASQQGDSSPTLPLFNQPLFNDHQLDGPVDEPSDLDDELQIPDQEPAGRNLSDEFLSLDQELRDARAILERLTRRSDISDEFWASVGLAPSVDRVDRIEERGERS